MNIASIDIGSNTVLLLIAELTNKQLSPILNMYESPRISRGLIPNGMISNDRIDKLMNVLSKYDKIIKQHYCDTVIISATNAMRIASNSKQIIDLIYNKFGYSVEIIDGAEEARRSFLGASSSFPEFNSRTVIDIGGGSTEIISGNDSKLEYKKSFQTGVVSLTEKYLNHFPYNMLDMEKVDNHLSQIFKNLTENIPANQQTIAVAGTPTTLSCIKQGLKTYDEALVEKSILTINDIRLLGKDIFNTSPKEMISKYGTVVSGREDVLFAGLLILKYFSKQLSIDRIYISSRGVRYGNIISYSNILK